MRLEVLRFVLGIAALAVVVVGAAKVLLPFLQPILWAMILGSATWPFYRRLRGWLGGREGLSAALMTLLLVLLVVLPLIFLALSLAREIEPTVTRVQQWAASDTLQVPEWIRSIPGAEEQLQPWIERLTDPRTREAWIKKVLLPAEGFFAIGRNVLRTLLGIVLTVFTLYFVYRDGDNAAGEASLLLDRIAAGRGGQLLTSIRSTVRAVFFGWLMTAACQGLVSMIGYWASGMPAPVFLGIVTGLAAVIPFGVGLVWIPAAISLVLKGAWGGALFLTIWSLGVVSLIDNVLRPLFISGGAKIPFILVFFGVLGGLATFGFLGLVLGPVFLAVLLALWREAREVLAETADTGVLAGPPPAPSDRSR